METLPGMNGGRRVLRRRCRMGKVAKKVAGRNYRPAATATRTVAAAARRPDDQNIIPHQFRASEQLQDREQNARVVVGGRRKDKSGCDEGLRYIDAGR